MSLFKQRCLAFIFPLLLAAPFLNRGYFVDDSYFVEIATWLKVHPDLPYHFRADDAGLQTRGIEENGFVHMVNPLAHQYYLALLLKVGGEREWFLRLGCVLLACFSALFVFELARRLTRHALLAALLTAATPVFWLTSYSLLIDGTLGFFFFGALFFFLLAAERDSIPMFALSGVFMGLGIITKYPGILILPLSATWLVLYQSKVKRFWPALISWTIALGVLLAFSLWTAHLYGQAHILGASSRMLDSYGWPKYLVFAVFLSGATLLPLISWALYEAGSKLFAALFVFIGTIFFSSSLGGFTYGQAFLLSLWVMTSLLFLLSAVRSISWTNIGPSWLKLNVPANLMILVWLGGFIAMMLLVMGWVAGRYYMIAIPAVVLWCVQLIDQRWPLTVSSILRKCLITLLLCTSLLAYADYRQADAARDIGVRLKQENFHGGERHFYLGDSFTSSYMKGHGWVPCFESTVFQPGDLILSKEVTMPSIWFFKKKLPLKEIREWNYATRFPLKVMDNQGSAGFYASVWGALPFTFSNSPWERFRLFEVQEFTSIPKEKKSSS